jgi:hypothetical protein
MIVRRLLVSYPSQRPDDPESYIAELVGVFSRYPEWAGERVLTTVRKSEFLPSVGAVEKALEAEVRVPRYAAEFEARAALPAPKPDPERREKMGGKFDELSREIKTAAANLTLEKARAE